MKNRSELRTSADAPVHSADLAVDDWEMEVEAPVPRQSVHLKLERDVFSWFHEETGGKGHITRMQNVLKAYVQAQKRKAEKKAG